MTSKNETDNTDRSDFSCENLPSNVLDNLIEGYQIIGFDYKYLYLNNSCIKHGRLRPEEHIGRAMMEMYPGIESTPMFSVLRECMEKRTRHQMENEFIFPDGSKGWFDLRFEPAPEGVCILSVEITERKLAEAEKVSRLSRIYQTLSDTNEAIVRIQDEKKLLQHICDVALKLSEFNLVWIGMHDQERNAIVPVGAAGENAQALRGLKLSLKPNSWASGALACVVFREGTLRVIQDYMGEVWSGNSTAPPMARGVVSALCLPLCRRERVVGTLTIGSPQRGFFDDEIVRLFEVMALNISYGLDNLAQAKELRETVVALKDSEERFRQLFESLPIGGVLYDPTDLHFVLFNDLAARNLGYTREEFAKLKMPDIKELPDEALIRKGIARIISGEKMEFETRHRAKNGKLHDVAVIAQLMQLDGQNFVLAILRDITERKKAAETLRLTQEQLLLSQKMEAVGRLAGGVAHDFNNILSVIMSYSAFAKEGLRPDDPLYEDLEEVHAASERGATLTRQLLAFSRKQILKPEMLNLNELVAGMEKMLRRLIGEDIALTFHPNPSLWKTKADPGQIEQVIMNLAVNARDAMRDGGRLTVETENSELTADSAGSQFPLIPGSYVMLSVSDSGCGIDDETMSRIFEPFFTTKEAGKGTGLGLATVYGIVKQSGGYIFAYSEIGKGTTFKIYLPRDVSADEVKTRPSPRKPATGHETILVVEDEKAVRNLVDRILTASGYTIIKAANGGEALLACEKRGQEVSLIVTDVVMPGMSGRQLADRLRIQWPNMKVLYMSGYTDDEIAHRGVLDPGTHLISKPFDAEALARKVREVLDEENDEG